MSERRCTQRWCDHTSAGCDLAVAAERELRDRIGHLVRRLDEEDVREQRVVIAQQLSELIQEYDQLFLKEN